jgi:hypothetical protein
MNTDLWAGMLMRSAQFLHYCAPGLESGCIVWFHEWPTPRRCGFVVVGYQPTWVKSASGKSLPAQSATRGLTLLARGPVIARD